MLRSNIIMSTCEIVMLIKMQFNYVACQHNYDACQNNYIYAFQYNYNACWHADIIILYVAGRNMPL